MSEIRTAAAAREIPLVDGKPPKRIQLLAIGANRRRDGAQPAYLVRDRAHAEAIVAASAAYHGSTEPMVDYDHQSVYGAKDGVGGTARAAAWMPRLVVDDAGIQADVEWTEAAATALEKREYRYISPYFGHRADGTVTRIFNAALTNRPELELRAVASQIDDPNERSTMLKDIPIALGLAEGASDADVLTAVKARGARVLVLEGERKALCSALGVAESADLAELRTAASTAGKVDPAKFVPMSEFERVRDQVSSIAEERTTASVDDAIRTGRVAPANREWALGYAKSDPTGFARFVGGQPEIVGAADEETRSAAAAAAKSDKLTAEERAICVQIGVSEADYLKSRKEIG